MSKVLKQDSEVLVSLEDSGLVRKVVYGVKPFNGFRLFASPKKSVDREVRALELLCDVDGVQRFVYRESDNCFYSRFVDGYSVNQVSSVPDSYFDALESVVKNCHDKGVFRIGQSVDDFFVTKDQKPTIIDFGNVLFADDSIAKIPGVLGFAKEYNLLKVAGLRRKYSAVSQKSLYSMD